MRLTPRLAVPLLAVAFLGGPASANVSRGSAVNGTGRSSVKLLAPDILGCADVRYHMAVGDGVADDTAEIQAAIDSFGATGGPVCFPPGKYKITSTLTLKKHTALLADVNPYNDLSPAWVSVAIDATGVPNNQPAILVPSGAYGVRIRGLALTGRSAGAALAGHSAIRAASAYNLQIEAVFTRGFYNGFDLTVQGLSVRDSGADVAAHAALLLYNCTYGSVWNSLFLNSGNSYPDATSGNIVVYGNGLANSHDLVIDVPMVDEAAPVPSVRINTADRVTFRNALIYYGQTAYGLMLGDGVTTAPTNVTIDNVKIEPFSGNVPTNTLVLRGSGHRLVNVTTNANGGGDVSDTSTDPVYMNVNGQWKQPTTDASGTPGNATINKASGKVAIAGAAATVVVTNSLVAAVSIVTATMQATDATCTSIKSVIPAAGSFTITANAACTAATKVAFTVTN